MLNWAILQKKPWQWCDSDLPNGQLGTFIAAFWWMILIPDCHEI
jgi:hypothetical protein